MLGNKSVASLFTDLSKVGLPKVARCKPMLCNILVVLPLFHSVSCPVLHTVVDNARLSGFFMVHPVCLQVLTRHLAPTSDSDLGDGDGAGRGIDAATAALTAQVSEKLIVE